MESSVRLKTAGFRILVGLVASLAQLGILGPNSLTFAQSPVPFVNQPLVPDAVSPGRPGFMLTINGTGFVPGSVAEWNGSTLTTNFVSQGRLTASVPSLDIAKGGTASITVSNPKPGGGSSGTVFFPIGPANSTVSLNRTDFGPTGVWNIYLVAADFNGDGNLDLAVTEFISGQVEIFLGNGDGTFQLSQAYSACHAHGLATGDFNGDGIIDLAIADAGCGQVTILLGNGNGTFTEKGNFDIGPGFTAPDCSNPASLQPAYPLGLHHGTMDAAGRTSTLVSLNQELFPNDLQGDVGFSGATARNTFPSLTPAASVH